MANWLKVGYFTAAEEAGADYWTERDWVSDGPGRLSGRWKNRRRPKRGSPYPPYGPRYEVGDFLVVYVTKRQVCSAILEVVEEPRWDPQWVDDRAKRGEGDKWGIVTKVAGRKALALDDAPKLTKIGVSPARVQRKGHVRLEDWEFEEAQQLIGRVTERRGRKASQREIPVEDGSCEGYDVVTKLDRRRALRREARLVEDFRAYLETKGDVVTRNELLPVATAHPLYSDLFNQSRRQLIEAKAGASRGEIRMAIGQLADYGRFIPRLAGRAVLLGSKPHPDLSALLEEQGIAAIWRSEDGFDDNAKGGFT
jgi:hypothetical protein